MEKRMALFQAETYTQDEISMTAQTNLLIATMPQARGGCYVELSADLTKLTHIRPDLHQSLGVELGTAASSLRISKFLCGLGGNWGGERLTQN